MKIEWTVKCAYDFPDEEINFIIDCLKKERACNNEKRIKAHIKMYILESGNDVFHNWNDDATEIIKKEIIRRMGK